MAELAFRVEPANNERLANLCGQFDEHLKQIEERLRVNISHRGDRFMVTGDVVNHVANAKRVIAHLYAATQSETLQPERVHLFMQEAEIETLTDSPEDKAKNRNTIKMRRAIIQCRGDRQAEYVQSVKTRDLWPVRLRH